MPGWTDYLIKKVLDRTFGAQAYSPPASLYFALFTTLPDDTGSGGTEVYQNNYERKAVANNASEFPDSTEGSGLKTNANAITFTTPSGSWGNIVGIGIYDAQVDDRQAFTTTHGSDLINCLSHGYSNGDAVKMTTTGTLPSGYSASQLYYVVNANTDDFQVALTPGGSAVQIGSNGSGTHSVWEVGNLLAVCQINTKAAPSGVPFVLEAGAVQLTLTSFSDYLNKRLLDYLFGSQSFTVPDLYCALFTTVPDSAGTGGTEVSGTSYVRKQVTNNNTEFPDSTLASGLKTNANSITFATPGGSWGDVKGFAIYDASLGGNLLLVDTISTTTVASGNPPIVAAGGLRITLN